MCDTISDTILDAYIKQDKNSRVAVETFASGNEITIAGQVTSKGQVDIEKLVRNKIKEVGFDNAKTDMDYKTCDIHINITKSGIRKFKNTGKTVSENSALPVILTPIKLPASVHITAEIKVAIRQSTIATLTFLRPAVFLISASSAFLNPVIKLHLAQIIILQ